MTVANLRIVHLESGDRLAKDVRCSCHVWPVVIGEPIRTCGFCGGADRLPRGRRMSRLLSTDQDSEAGRYCPSCNADWRGGEIPRDALEKGYYGHKPPCEKRRSWDDDYDPSVPCTCPPRYYSHLVGVVRRGDDCVGVWLCQICGTRWDRWTGEGLPAATRTA